MRKCIRSSGFKLVFVVRTYCFPIHRRVANNKTIIRHGSKLCTMHTNISIVIEIFINFRIQQFVNMITAAFEWSKRVCCIKEQLILECFNFKFCFLDLSPPQLIGSFEIRGSGSNNPFTAEGSPCR